MSESSITATQGYLTEKKRNSWDMTSRFLGFLSETVSLLLESKENKMTQWERNKMAEIP